MAHTITLSDEENERLTQVAQLSLADAVRPPA